MSGQPAGLHCPGCEQMAYMILGATQAFCGNDDCAILIWDPLKTPAENMSAMNYIDLSGWFE